MSRAEDCPLQHSYTALSYTTAVICAILCLATTCLNVLIVYIIFHNRQNKFNILFYKLLLNIAVSDTLVGLVADTCFAVVHVSEAKNSGLEPEQVMTAHTIMFVLGGVSLITLVFLCIDRIYALFRPHSYRKGLSKTASRILIASAWCLSVVLVSIYFVVGFMKYLIVFTSFNILFPFILLIFTAVVYHMKLVKKVEKEDGNQAGSETSTLKRKDGNVEKGRKATKAFLKMLLVFIFSYLPAAFITIYFSLCSVCDCLLIHILRDVSIVFILTGSLFRAINFLLSLTSLRKEMRHIFSRNHSDDSCSISARMWWNYELIYFTLMKIMLAM